MFGCAHAPPNSHSIWINFQGAGQIGAIVCEKLQDGIQEFRMIEAGHVCVLSWMFLRHPDPNPCGPPSARPERHSPLQADGYARLATLVIAPPPA